MTQNFDVKTVSVQMTVAPTTVTTVLDPESYDKGYNAGETDGHAAGKTEGYTEGYDKGKSDGYGEGWDVGNDEGYAQGRSEGYSDGFVQGEAQGYRDGEKVGYQSGKSDGYAEGYTKGGNDGYTAGHADGYDEGIEAGKQAEYDAYWDDFQWDGERVNYYGAFAGRGWSKNTLKPKHKIVPKDETINSQYASHLFFHCNRGNNARSGIIDFRTIAHLFDFSGVINATRMFAESLIDYIVADLSNAQSMLEAFSEYWGAQRTHITLTTSEKTIFHTTTFGAAIKLTDLIFTEGSIIASSLNVGDSPLNKESIISIINALSKNATGQTLTLKKSAKEAAFTSDEWNELIATKSNWTISLI